MCYQLTFNIYPIPGGNRAYTKVGRQKASRKIKRVQIVTARATMQIEQNYGDHPGKRGNLLGDNCGTQF